jgi:scyllo-inositol 2-dehydrogenase (NADP+)
MTRVALVGPGWVGLDRHLPALRQIPGVELIGVMDNDQARADEVAKTHGIAIACTTPGPLIEAGVEAVTIATPPWAHASLATMFLEHHVHVFCEKPMAMTVPEARQMADVAIRTQSILCLSHNLLWSRAVREAEGFLRGATISHVIGGQLSSSARRLPTWIGDLPGGLVFDECPHLLYLANHLLGTATVDHVRVGAIGRSGEPTSVEVLLTGKRSNATIVMGLDAPVSEWQVVVVSSVGVVVIDLFRDIAVRIKPDNTHRPLDILRTSARAVSEHLRGFAISGFRFARGQQKWGHELLISEFITAVRTGGPSPVPLDDALAVMAMVDTIASAVVARREADR